MQRRKKKEKPSSLLSIKSSHFQTVFFHTLMLRDSPLSSNCGLICKLSTLKIEKFSCLAHRHQKKYSHPEVAEWRLKLVYCILVFIGPVSLEVFTCFNIIITTLLSVNRISMSLAVACNFKASTHQMTLFTYSHNEVESIVKLLRNLTSVHGVLTACVSSEMTQTLARAVLNVEPT